MMAAPVVALADGCKGDRVVKDVPRPQPALGAGRHVPAATFRVFSSSGRISGSVAELGPAGRDVVAGGLVVGVTQRSARARKTGVDSDSPLRSPTS